ncbi:MAG: HNH endonuclease signature motif containing protein [Bacteroidales bacterium]
MTHQYHYGKKFYQDKKTGYWISSACPKIRAHVFVWIYHHGEIEKGYHIHHIDGNKSNNSIENLQKILAKEHLSLHFTEEKKERARKWADKIRPQTKKWHRSEEGRQWHTLHGKKCWKNRKKIKKVCEECTIEFTTKTYHQEFCSNKCKSRNRRKSGVDNIALNCKVCDKVFYRNKYGRSITCGRKCGGILKSKEYKSRRT